MNAIKLKIRLKMIKTACFLEKNGPLKRPVKSVLRRAGKQVCHLGVTGEGADRIIPLAVASTCTQIAPDFGSEAPKFRKGTYPAINAYLMKDAMVSAYSSQIVKNDKLLVSRQRLKLRRRIPSHGAGLGYYDRQHSVCSIRAAITFEKAIFLGGDGAYNWYHYVIECMSKAYLTKFLPDSYRDYPIIVPDEARHIKSFTEILNVLAPERKILTIGRETAHIRNLIVIDEISQGPFNLYPGKWPVLSDYSQHESVLNAYFSELRHAFSPSPIATKRFRRIFIVRPDVRRNYNQDALVEIAKRFGFLCVSPETLSLREQAKIFSEASHIIGASGAAWVNMIFAPHSFRGLTWILPQYSEFCSYSMLAHLLNHDMRYLVAQPDCKIMSTDDAYKASYTVSLEEFEAALVRLCGDSQHDSVP